MARKRKLRWLKGTMALREDHTWKSPPGYSVVVLDRGAVRFNIPRTWVVVPDPTCLTMHDCQPPDDNCRLAVSYLKLAPRDWSGLPLAELVKAVAQDDKRDIREVGEVVTVLRGDLEVAWLEMRQFDPKEKRSALSRVALARGWNLQALITFDFWLDDAERFAPVWDEVMRSVELGKYVDDPTKGDVLH